MTGVGHFDPHAIVFAVVVEQFERRQKRSNDFTVVVHCLIFADANPFVELIGADMARSKVQP